MKDRHGVMLSSKSMSAKMVICEEESPNKQNGGLVVAFSFRSSELNG